MALKDHHQTPSSSYYETMLEVGSSAEFPHNSPYEFDDKDCLENPNNSKNKFITNNNHNVISNSPPISSSSSANTIHHEDRVHSLVNFEPGYGSFMDSDNGSLLSFQQDDHNYQIWEASSSSSSKNHHQQQSELEEMKSCSLLLPSSSNEWLYVDINVANRRNRSQDSSTQERCFNKRPQMEEEEIMQVSKKHCKSSNSKKLAKTKSASIAKDPQSVVAKNRRERISAKLKILQDLVPNGNKVDLVTMLEKAIGYVKFLQLQMKVLATDEFWPAAGGKAPDISQVREAIDAIISSQRSNNNCSSN